MRINRVLPVLAPARLNRDNYPKNNQKTFTLNTNNHKIIHIIKGFSLAKYSFAFPNRFNDSLIYWHGIPIGNRKYGLCGGMCVATSLYYKYNMLTSSNNMPPTDKNDPQLLDFLKECQVESLSFLAMYNYFTLMFNNSQEDSQKISEEWPKIIATLNLDQPCLIGLIRVKGSIFSPHSWLDVFKQHQVLAYGYTIHNEEVILKVYDPNCPKDNDITLSFNKNGEGLRCSISLIPTYTLFKIDYQFNIKPFK